MIIGHQKQWQFLKKSAELNKFPHALLFSGQEQIGKRTLAIELVKFLNCQASKKPCGLCRTCQDIKKGVHPDFILISAAGKDIQISQIRELIQKLAFYSYSALFKVAIIDQAHLMTKEAQNCFLKTLEEPKGRTFLILITEYPEMLFSTILSRVQKIRFFPVKKREIENYFIKQGISQKKAEYFSSLSLGRPGLAIDFSLNEQKLKDREKFISDIAKISGSDFSFRFQYAKDLSQEISDIKEILDIWLRYFRGLFISHLKGDSKSKYPLSKLKKIISLIQSLNYLISSTNINPKLAFELLLMEI